MATETLRQKQSRFVSMIGKLIAFAYEEGYELTFSEAYRSPSTAKIYAEQGKGIAASLHTKRLALDLNLFKDGVWLQNTEDHSPLGEYWESIGGTWGGRFQDGNHYSLEHNGVK